MICARPTLLTLTWASGRVLLSNLGTGISLGKSAVLFLQGTFRWGSKIEMVSSYLRIFSAKWNVKHRVFSQFKYFLGNENHTRQTGKWSMICARPTLLTLTWASGRVLMSNPGTGMSLEKSAVLFLQGTFRWGRSITK